MKAMRIHEFGGAENLSFEEVSAPKPASGQVLVRVVAASVNPVDTKVASGIYRNFIPVELPWIPGRDFAGVVDSVPPGPCSFKPGDAVFGDCRPGGAYAEFVAADCSAIALKPHAVSFVEAASLPIAALTAWQGLFEHGRLQTGQTALIHAGAGGVGMFAVQLAHWKGATVIATASEKNHDYVHSLGADTVIDYNATAFESVAQDVDMVFDLVGGDVAARSVSCLRPDGYLVCAVSPTPDDKLAGTRIHATRMMVQPSARGLAQIADLITAGSLRTLVAATFPLERAGDAWNAILTHHTRGKIVLEVAR